MVSVVMDEDKNYGYNKEKVVIFIWMWREGFLKSYIRKNNVKC